MPLVRRHDGSQGQESSVTGLAEAIRPEVTGKIRETLREDAGRTNEPGEYGEGSWRLEWPGPGEHRGRDAGAVATRCHG